MLKKTQAEIAVLLILLFSSGIKAQQSDIKFEHFSIDQGLSQSSVNCILQDHKGYMWFGTQDGLNRYDGYSFTTLKHSLQEKNSLSDSYITSMAEDRAGNLWIGTNGGGLNRYDPANRSFTLYQNDPKVPNSLSDNHITVVYIETNGKIWIGTDRGGLNRWDVDHQSFTIFRNVEGDANSISGNCINAIYRDSSGRLWIGTDVGLNRFDEKSNSFNVYRHDPKNPKTISEDLITTIIEDNSGTLWIGTKTGINRYDETNNNFITYHFNSSLPGENGNDFIKVVVKDALGMLWFGTINGLNRFSPDTENFTVYRKNPDLETGLSNNKISSIYLDRSGALWVGTLDGGINRFDPQSQRFIAYRKDPANPRFISDNSITSFYEDSRGVLWVGTVNGLNRYNTNSSQSTVYYHDDRNPNSIKSNFIKVLYEDRSGTLWIASNEGLNSYDVKAERFNSPANNPLTAVQIIDITSILEDKEGIFWLGTFNHGLIKFDPKSRTTKFYKNEPSSTGSISGDRISVIYEDRNGRLWLGTMGYGLNLYDRNSDSFSVFRNDQNPIAGISSNRITSICEDRSGTLWIGTTNGLNRFDTNNRSFSVLTQNDGLANDSVYGILEDREGNLWISTNRGISKYNPNEKKFLNYEVADGLQSNEFNFGAFFKNSRGEMFFGGINGFNRFYPEQIKNNLFKPPIAITSFKATDSKGNQFPGHLSISTDLQLSLPYNYNFFSFEFAALNYTRPEKNRYSYKMEGVDSDWIYSGNRRYAGYPNLNPGEYLFRVKGSNNDGVWNEEGARVKIIISPPLWKTWWAYLLYLGTVAGIGYGGHRLRLENLERRNRLLEEKIQERTFALAREKEELIKSKEELIESHKQTELIFSALSEVLPGTMLDNRYRLEDKLGSGGFGVVYRATHLELDRSVAIKVFSPTAINTTVESLERFRLEGISACRVNHPNAISVLDSGVTSRGIAYIVMELLEGITLKQELEQKGRLPLSRIAEILIPVCDVLSKAHSLGIIHRDIKPDNIFLHRSKGEEVVKLVDFGIAKMIGEEWGTKAQSLTGTGKLIGTPNYMAPERLENELSEGKADVYSLGVVLYEMLCGRVPFHSALGPWQTALMHMTIEPQPPSQLNPGIPEQVEAVILRALIKDPEKRPNAAELKREFLTTIGLDPDLQSADDFKTVIHEHLKTEEEQETVNKSERWKKIDELLDAAMERDPEEWKVFLDQACTGDEEVRLEVESLLAAHQKASNFLGSSALEVAAKLAANETSDDGEKTTKAQREKG